MVERGFVDPRFRDEDRPSVQSLSRETGLHATTINDILHGKRQAKVESQRALQAALGSDVASWLHREAGQDWEPPAEASLLTDRQRRAVAELIKSMTEQRGGLRDGASMSDVNDVNDGRPRIEAAEGETLKAGRGRAQRQRPGSRSG